jgi:POT family proton-dependent oligopeptide transporter
MGVALPSDDKQASANNKQDEKSGTKRSFFGHPWGLLNLCSTEFCERFSYYGMRAILIYYIYASVSSGGLGLPEEDALYVLSLFGAAVYLLSVVGGWMADRLIGSYRAVFYGGIVIAAGHIVLSIPNGGPPATFAALGLIAVGTGLLKPNVSQMVGTLYSERDRRRQAGFNIFVMGINLGSFFSPFITGIVADEYTYHAAFAIPAVFMFIALGVYRGLTKKTLKDVPRVAPNPIKASEAKSMAVKVIAVLAGATAVILILVGFKLVTLQTFGTLMPFISLVIVVVLFGQMLLDKGLSKVEKHRLIAYGALFIAATIFWAIEEQQSSVFAILADGRVDNAVGALQVLPAWYQSVNPLVIIVLAPVCALVWQRWRRQPSIFAKMCVGLVLTAVAFVVPAIGFLGLGGEDKVSPLMIVVPIVLFSVGELFVSPVGLSATTELAPGKYQSRMMSIWFLANTFGQGINAFCFRWFSKAEPSGFFIGYAVAAVAISLLLILLLRPLTRWTHGIH